MEIVFFWIVFTILVGVLASTKDRSFLGWAFLAAIISPILAGIILLIVGSARRCPYCRGGIPSDAIVCKHCGRDLTAGSHREF